MTYTLEQFAIDHGVTQEESDKAKAEMLEQVRLCELEDARKERKLTQKQLAKQMGVSQKRVSVLESGDIAKVKVKTLERYLKALGGALHVTATLPDGRLLKLV